MTKYQLNPVLIGIAMMCIEMLVNVLFGLQSIALYLVPVIAGLYIGMKTYDFPSFTLFTKVLLVAIIYVSTMSMIAFVALGGTVNTLFFMDVLLGYMQTFALVSLGVLVMIKSLRKKHESP